MLKKVVGFEAANSFVKVFTRGRQAVYANTITELGQESFSKVLETTERNANTVYTVNGKSYNVGLTHKYRTSSGTDIERYKSEMYLIESLIAISQVVDDGETITVATGIPADHYHAKGTAKQYINAALVGTHTILVNGNELTFTIKEVVVILQPLASYFYALVNELGTADDSMIERIENTETLIIDIGFGTTDLAYCLGYNLHNFDVVTDSMKTVYEKVAQQLKADAAAKNVKLATAKIKLLDLEKQIREKKYFTYANKRYDVMGTYEKALKETASNIIADVRSSTGLDQFTTIIFTGGGSKSMAAYIENELKDPATDNLPENIFFIDSKAAQMANVKGYFVYTNYLR